MKDPEAESKRWFEQAKYDLKTSRWNVKGGLFAVFLAEFLLTLIRRKILSKPLKWPRGY
jgi:HEPN domain-containing protein